MAVSLPSDLVFDVMKNADPVRQRTALAKLRLATDESGTAFAEAMSSAKTPSTLPAISRSAISDGGLLTNSPGEFQGGVDKPSVYRGFERMVLRNLFETLLPDEQSGSFGEGPSAGIWRSMVADQFAGIYTENGGIGLASLLTSAGAEDGPRREVQWPYFSMSEISGVKG